MMTIEPATRHTSNKRIDTPHTVADHNRNTIDGSAISSRRRMRCSEQ